MDRLSAALELLDRDLSVIPIQPRGKRPLVAWQEFQARRATPEEVKSWFERWPEANLAIVTGSISGLFVVDADGPAGEEYLRSLPVTGVYAATGKGVHAFFRPPAGVTVANRARIAPEVDVRGEGGYVVCPPSLHPSGRAYQWRFTPELDGWDDLAELAPSWAQPAAPGLRALPAITHPADPAGAAAAAVRGNLALDLSGVRLPADETRPVAQGARNSTLTALAGRWMALGLEPEQARALAFDWNRRLARPPLGEREVETVIRSVAKAEARNHPAGRPPALPDPEVRPAAPAPPEAGEFPRRLLEVDGVLGLMMEHIDRAAAASHPQFSLAAAIATLGAVLGQRVMTETGLRTNFYMICLGYSGSGKNAPHSVLPAVLARTAVANILGPDTPTSAAAILKWLGREDGSQRSMIMYLDEIGLLLSGMKHPDSPAREIPSTLMRLFSADRPIVKSLASAANVGIPWHHVALYGSSTPRRFWEALGGGEVVDGFLARMLVWESRHEAPLPKTVVENPDPADLIAAIEDLAGISPPTGGGNLAAVPRPFVVPRDAAAAQALDEWAREYHRLKNETAEAEDGASAIYGRAAEHAAKLALVHFMSRLGAEGVDNRVELMDMLWAMEVMDHLIPRTLAGVRENVAEGPFHALQQRVLGALRRLATAEQPLVPWRLLLRNLCLPSRQLQEVMETLVVSGRVFKGEHKPARGPSSPAYALAKSPEDGQKTRRNSSETRRGQKPTGFKGLSPVV